MSRSEREVADARREAFEHRPTATSDVLQRRHRLMRAVRAFFDAAGFTEVETPVIVRSPGLELHLEALEVVGLPGRRWLQTSPEYHMKRLLAAGMRDVYQLCKTFRRDEQGHLHQPEFTMLEWYRANAGFEEMMRDTEQLVAHVARELLGKTVIPGVTGEVDISPPWERLTVREAFRRHASDPLHVLLRDEEAFYRALVDQVEPHLGRGRPTLLTHYPASMAALARICPHDPSVAERFEAYVDGVELCNGFGELVDAAEQRRRLEADVELREQSGKARYPIDERFLAALEHGVPPSGGNALGIDRLAMLVLGLDDIAKVVTFSAARA
jgi:elongation factor P--(R)-beta-lysine ligase